MKLFSKFASFFLFPALVLLAHMVASLILDLYAIFPHLDIPFHYMGGFSIAYAATQILAWLEREQTTVTLHRIVFLVLVLSLTASATVFWEFAEFIGDALLGTNIQVSLANTMQDQFMGILGGVTWAWFCYRKDRRQMQT